jgi:hypothetical protein
MAAKCALGYRIKDKGRRDQWFVKNRIEVNEGG